MTAQRLTAPRQRITMFFFFPYLFFRPPVYKLRGMMGVKPPASTEREAQADERLLVEAAQKDPARFGDLYELHFELVYAFVSRRVGSRDLAEDLTSEVFHKALANLHRFEWRGVPFGA